MNSAKNLLEEVLHDLNYAMGLKYSSLFKSWESIAGENLAAHSRVVDLKKGVLYIESDHPGWYQMLEMEKNSIKKKVQKQYPMLNIKEIRITITRKKESNKISEPVLEPGRKERKEDVSAENSRNRNRNRDISDAQKNKKYNEKQDMEQNMNETAAKDELHTILTALKKHIEKKNRDKMV